MRRKLSISVRLFALSVSSFGYFDGFKTDYSVFAQGCGLGFFITQT
jgi:hypothetical protein